jgi:hypothetical protein
MSVDVDFRTNQEPSDQEEVVVWKNYISTVRSGSHKRNTVGRLVNDQIKS